VIFIERFDCTYVIVIQEEFREVRKGYKDDKVVWLFVSLGLGQVQAFP